MMPASVSAREADAAGPDESCIVVRDTDSPRSEPRSPTKRQRPSRTPALPTKPPPSSRETLPRANSTKRRLEEVELPASTTNGKKRHTGLYCHASMQVKGVVAVERPSVPKDEEKEKQIQWLINALETEKSAHAQTQAARIEAEEALDKVKEELARTNEQHEASKRSLAALQEQQQQQPGPFISLPSSPQQQPQHSPQTPKPTHRPLPTTQPNSPDHDPQPAPGRDSPITAILQSQIKSNHTLITKLRATIAAHQDKITSLQRTITDLHSGRIARLTARNTALQAANADLQAQLASQTKTLETQLADEKAQVAELVAAQRKLLEVAELEGEKRKEGERYKKEMERYKGEAETCKEESQKYKKEIEWYKMEVERIQCGVERLMEEGSAGKAEVERLTWENGLLQEEAERCKKEMEWCKTEAERGASAAGEWKAEAERLAGEIDKAKVVLHQREVEVERLQQEKSRLGGVVEMLKRDIEGYEAQLRGIQKKLDLAINNQKEMERMSNQMQDREIASEREVERLSKELDVTTRRAHAADNTAANLLGTVGKLSVEKDQLITAKEQAEKDKSALMADLETCKQTSAARQEEITRLQKACGRAEEEWGRWERKYRLQEVEIGKLRGELAEAEEQQTLGRELNELNVQAGWIKEAVGDILKGWEAHRKSKTDRQAKDC